MERDPRRYGEPVPGTGIPETEEEAAERSEAQQQEDTLDQEQAQEPEDEDDSGL